MKNSALFFLIIIGVTANARDPFHPLKKVNCNDWQSEQLVHIQAWQLNGIIGGRTRWYSVLSNTESQWQYLTLFQPIFDTSCHINRIQFDHIQVVCPAPPACVDAIETIMVMP